MIKKILFSISLTLCFVLTVSAADLSLGNIRVTVEKDTPYPFRAEDIISAVTDEFIPDKIQFTALPSPDTGTILKNGKPLVQNETIPFESISTIIFQPAKQFTGSADCKIVVISGTRVSNEATFTLEYIVVSKPPELSDLYYTTERNIAREMPLYPATYNGQLQFVIPSPPAHGTLVAKDENYHTVIYTPNQNYVGQDQFTYQQADNEENRATVTVTVTEPVTPLPGFVHEDLKTHWANYSAGNLADRGIMHGEMIGGKFYFYPDAKITRWEFLNMLLASIGVNIDSAQMGYIDRYEDAASLPSYIQKIAAISTKLGILEGIKEGDHLYIYPYQELTRAQAVTILGKTIAPDIESEDHLFFTDRDDIPLWARKHFINLVNFKIIQGYEDNTIRPYSPLNKAQTAQMLYQGIKLTEKEPQILRSLKKSHQFHQ